MSAFKIKSHQNQIIIIAFIIGIIILFKYFGGAFLPFIIGIITAVLLRRFVLFLESVTGMSSKITGGICLIVCYLLLFISAYFIIRRFTVEIIRILEYLPDFYDTKITNTIRKIQNSFSDFFGNKSEFEQILMYFFDATQLQFSDFLKNISSNLVPKIASFLLEIPDLLITITVTMVASFFICIDYKNIRNFLCLDSIIKNSYML